MKEFILIAEQFLSEMIVRTHSSDPSILVAFRDSIWILGNEFTEDEIQDINNRTGLSLDPDEDVYDLTTVIREERPDILVGSLDNDVLTPMSVGGLHLNPITSLLIKKVCHQLNLTVNQSFVGWEGDDDEYSVDRHEMLGEIPNVVYHGTAIAYANDILRQGLNPDTEHGNWEKVGKFNDRVFFASDIEHAIYHANGTAHKLKSQPIIFAFRIPDRSKIDVDYDVATDFYGDGHEKLTSRPDYHASYTRTNARSNASAIQKNSPKTDFTRETGIFSYLGRVPASFIQSIEICSSPAEGHEGAEMNPMTRYNRETIRKRDEMLEAIDLVNEYGFYDPAYAEELKSLRDGDEDDDW